MALQERRRLQARRRPTRWFVDSQTEWRSVQSATCSRQYNSACRFEKRLPNPRRGTTSGTVQFETHTRAEGSTRHDEQLLLFFPIAARLSPASCPSPARVKRRRETEISAQA